MRALRLMATLATLTVAFSACGEKEEAVIRAPAGGQPEGTEGEQVRSSVAGLRGRDFAAAREGSDPSFLRPDRRVTVGFHKRRSGAGIGWEAGCNGFGGKVEITADRLLVGRIAGTLIKCPRPEQAQDGRLGKFFGSDPRWQLRDGELTLRSEGRILVAVANNPG